LGPDRPLPPPNHQVAAAEPGRRAAHPPRAPRLPPARGPASHGPGGGRGGGTPFPPPCGAEGVDRPHVGRGGVGIPPAFVIHHTPHMPTSGLSIITILSICPHCPSTLDRRGWGPVCEGAGGGAAEAAPRGGGPGLGGGGPRRPQGVLGTLRSDPPGLEKGRARWSGVVQKDPRASPL